MTGTMTTSKTKKKPMTLEGFAAAVHKDYLAISKNMATKADLDRFASKQDLYDLSQKMVTREEFRELQSDVKMITDTMVTKADLTSTLGEELAKSEYAHQLKDIRDRVNALESKLGIKPARRAL
jgi:dsDNA-specific endonuclease/ATPase MutS2